MNCAQRKQYVQYAWQVCAAEAKNNTVSEYLCCTPVSSAFFGALRAFCPAGCGLSPSRISSTAALIVSGSFVAHASSSVARADGTSMSIVGKMSR